MATVTGTTDFLVVDPSAAADTVTGTTPYTVTNPGATGTTITRTTPYTVVGRPRLMVRSGGSVVAVRLGMRQGSSITWLSPPLP